MSQSGNQTIINNFYHSFHFVKRCNHCAVQTVEHITFHIVEWLQSAFKKFFITWRASTMWFLNPGLLLSTLTDSRVGRD